MYHLTRTVRIDTDMDCAWEFISTPRNLNVITPPDLQFELPADLPEDMREGMLVTYGVALPLLGKTTWVSELKHIEVGRSFVDEQRAGPYKFWYHYHQIAPTADGQGVEFYDRVDYALPFGPFGRLAHRLYVRPTLERIFAFREQRLRELLEGEPGA